MADVTAETPSEGRVRPALRQRISISNPLGCSSQTHLNPNVSADMPFTRTPSPPRSRSRSRASRTDASQPRQMSTPHTLSIDLPSPASRESSETRYGLYSSHPAPPSHEDPPYCELPRIERSHKSTSALRANESSYSRRESTTPPSEPSGQPTPLSNNSSSKSKDSEVKRPLVPGSSYSNTHSGEQERQNPAPGGSDAIEEVASTLKPQLMDSPRPSNDSGDLASDEDVEMGDLYDESESDDDSTEERWMPTLKEFEASVVAATGGNLPLAARLIPQLQEIFRQEKSPVIGTWETTYRKSAGNSHDCDSGAAAGRGDSLHPYNGQDNDRKRPRRDDEDTGEENNNSQEGNGDDKRKSHKISSTEDLYSLEFACPFKKKNPEKYNGDYRSSNVKKGEYKKCDSGFDNDKMFREHLMRTHLYTQCGKCSQMFTEKPREERELAFKTHQEDLEQCRGTPPDVNEGITEVQWARIKKLPRKSRSSLEKLNVEKWTEIWKILFPKERLPTPWHIPNTAKLEKHSNLAQDVAEFKKCYNSTINDTENETLSPEETAAHAFATWWTKRFAEQRKRQKMSQEAPQRNPEIEAEYTPKEDGQLYQAIYLTNTNPGQGRADMKKFQSLQFPSQGFSAGQASQGNPLAHRRAVTGTNPGYQVAHHGYGQMPATTQPHPAQLGPNPVYSPSEEIMHQPQHGVDPMKLINTSGGQPPNATLDLQEYFVQSQQLGDWAAPTTIPVDYSPYFDEPNLLPSSENPPAPQANPMPLRPQPQTVPLPQSQPQIYPTSTYNTSTPQRYYVQQQQSFVPAGHSGTTNNNPYGNAPVQNPQWDLPVDRQRRRRDSEQRQQQYSPEYDDPNRGHDWYGAD